MSKSAEPELSYWRYIAGVESADQLRASRRPRILAWTAAPESARGDIVVIYGKSPVQAYVAVARQCHDPIEGSGDRHWTWLQIQPLKEGLAETRVSTGARTRDHRGLKKPAGGSYNRIEAGAGRGDFLRMLTSGDNVARSRLEKWSGGRSPYPHVSTAELRKAWWEPPERDGLSDDHEQSLSDGVASALVCRRDAKWLDEGGIDDYYLEMHLKTKDGRDRYADIVLLDARRGGTLILVEVKKHARPTAGHDPISQVLTNQKALRRKHKGWRVRCVAVAVEFRQETLDQAKRDNVECLRCDAKGGCLRPA